MKQKYYWILGIITIMGIILIASYIIKYNANNIQPITNDKLNKGDGDSIQPKDEKCGIQNCHGLDISCGPNIPELCTFEYILGDFCSQYANCGIVNEKCQLIENEKFNACKSCVEECNKLSGPEAFICEDDCREQIQ